MLFRLNVVIHREKVKEIVIYFYILQFELISLNISKCEWREYHEIKVAADEHSHWARLYWRCLPLKLKVFFLLSTYVHSKSK